MDLDSVADQLYALPPGEFTAARNAQAKQARAEGDKELAAHIAALEKPTTAAWLVNQLAREMGDQLEPLIALGRDLREATSNISGEELRGLTRQRHRVVAALVQQARQLGAEHGTRVTEAVAGEVQQTLDASLADAEVADAVLAGRLTHAQEYAGFGAPMGAGSAAPARRTSSTERRRSPQGKGSKEGKEGKEGKVADLAARRRESAERALSEADDRVEAARSDQEAAAEQQHRADTELESAKEEVARLREELEAAEDRARTAAKAERTVRERVRRAEQTLARAEQARAEAAERLAELDA